MGSKSTNEENFLKKEERHDRNLHFLCQLQTNVNASKGSMVSKTSIPWRWLDGNCVCQSCWRQSKTFYTSH